MKKVQWLRQRFIEKALMDNQILDILGVLEDWDEYEKEERARIKFERQNQI